MKKGSQDLLNVLIHFCPINCLILRIVFSCGLIIECLVLYFKLFFCSLYMQDQTDKFLYSVFIHSHCPVGDFRFYLIGN